MDHETVLAFEYDDAATATRVERSLRPEVGDIASDRTRVSLDRDGRTVEIAVAARDLVGLRAGLNTWTTLVGVAEAVDGPGEA